MFLKSGYEMDHRGGILKILGTVNSKRSLESSLRYSVTHILVVCCRAAEENKVC